MKLILPEDFISIDSPMAKALLRRSEGDEVVVSRPNGTAAFVVTAITYEECILPGPSQ